MKRESSRTLTLFFLEEMHYISRWHISSRWLFGIGNSSPEISLPWSSTSLTITLSSSNSLVTTAVSPWNGPPLTKYFFIFFVFKSFLFVLFGFYLSQYIYWHRAKFERLAAITRTVSIVFIADNNMVVVSKFCYPNLFA